jgi:hypothetical protein
MQTFLRITNHKIQHDKNMMKQKSQRSAVVVAGWFIRSMLRE